jgi:transposase-like protein
MEAWVNGVSTGVAAAGGREILGIHVGDSKEEVFWRGFLRTLRERGLSGVRLIISDQHSGLVAALARQFQGVAHQRCRVHFARNLLALVPRSHKDMVASVFRTAFAQPDAQAAAQVWDQVRDQLAQSFPNRAADGRGEIRSAGLHRVPAQPLAQDLVDRHAAAIGRDADPLRLSEHQAAGDRSVG